MRVPISVQAWLANPALQTALINAIAAAAGVDPSRVTVKSKAPVLGGGARRLLGLIAKQAKVTELAVTVDGGEIIHDADALVESVLARTRALHGPLQFLSLAAKAEPRVAATRLALL